jgi:arginase
MKMILLFLAVAISSCAVLAPAQATGKSIRVALVQNSYSGSREEAEISPGPDALGRGGLVEILAGKGCDMAPTRAVRLTPQEDKQYGAWNRMGLANRHLAGMVSETLREGRLPVGLLANCNSLMGMLAGVQHSRPDGRPLRVGLVWIDAHADFNTPETTLSGMLGGMPVATSAGLCLTRLRAQSGLDPALPFSYIVMAGVRDADPLEQELLDRHGIEMIPAPDLRRPSEKIDAQMKRLSDLTDSIYVHVDMDVLDPREVAGHSLTVPGGPSSAELAAALEAIFKFPKAAAFGIASYPAERDKDKASLKAAYNLTEGVVRGVAAR